MILFFVICLWLTTLYISLECSGKIYTEIKYFNVIKYYWNESKEDRIGNIIISLMQLIFTWFLCISISTAYFSNLKEEERVKVNKVNSALKRSKEFISLMGVKVNVDTLSPEEIKYFTDSLLLNIQKNR